MSDDVATAETAPAKPPIRFRNLRIAVSVFFGLLTVALCVLWVRSYWRLDTTQWNGNSRSVFGTLYQGRVGLTFSAPLLGLDDSWSYDSNKITSGTSLKYNDGTGQPLPSYLGFQSSWLSAAVQRSASVLVVPLWFVALVTAILAVSPWLRVFPLHFKLRTLLIATTLVAVVLGAVVWAGR